MISVCKEMGYFVLGDAAYDSEKVRPMAAQIGGIF
jgi:hypothetical protein